MSCSHHRKKETMRSSRGYMKYLSKRSIRSLIPPENKRGFRLVEVQVPGLDRPEERHGTKFVGTAPGYRLKFDKYLDERNEFGRKLTFITSDAETGLTVRSCFQFYDGIAVVRSWTEVENHGKETQTLEYVSSFALTGLGKGGLLNRDEKILISIPYFILMVSMTSFARLVLLSTSVMTIPPIFSLSLV